MACDCNSNGFGNNWLWLIILLCLGNNGTNGCGNSCGDGNNWWWIIIALLLGGGCGNGYSVCEDK